MTLDHIEKGSGAKHRKALFGRNTNGPKVYIDLRDREYPPIIQVLCYNCNIAKEILGVCPHKGETP